MRSSLLGRLQDGPQQFEPLDRKVSVFSDRSSVDRGLLVGYAVYRCVLADTQCLVANGFGGFPGACAGCWVEASKGFFDRVGVVLLNVGCGAKDFFSVSREAAFEVGDGCVDAPDLGLDVWPPSWSSLPYAMPIIRCLWTRA